MEKDSHSDEEIKEIFSLKNVAVVGMSKNKERQHIMYQNTFLIMGLTLYL